MTLNILEERARINDVDDSTDELMTITRKKHTNQANNMAQVSHAECHPELSLLETLKSSLKERAEVDYKKIARIKAELAAGIYQINNELIAQEMLDYMA